MELSELLNLFKEASFYSWDLYLMKFNKKSGGSFFMDKVESSPYLADEVSDIVSSYMDKLMDKIKDIIPYSDDYDFKGFMVSLDLNDDRIKDNANSFIESIANCGASLSSRYCGYVLAGKDNVNNKDLYLITKTNPFVNLKSLLINPVGNIEEPTLIKLTKRIDCIIYNGSLFADSARFEKIFGLDSSNKALCEANRQLVIESKVFNDQSNALLLNNRLLKSFQKLEISNIEALKNRTDDVKILERYAELRYMGDGSINLDTTQSVKMALKFLCNKIAFRDGKAFEASTLKPLPLLNDLEENEKENN